MTTSTLDQIATTFPLTEAQTELWLLSQVSDEANCAFNECCSLALQGSVDIEAIKRALHQVVQRNELLRATVDKDGQSIYIHNELDPLVIEDDWTGLSPKEQDEERIKSVAKEGTTPFDLEAGPLLRVRIQQRAAGDFLLTFTAHHIVLDGWSLWVFSRDLGHLYAAEVSGSKVELPAVDRYEDYAKAMAEYHESAEGIADEAFWVDQFRESIPVLELPTDRPRPTLKTFAASRCDHTLDADLVAQLRKTGGKHGCSLFNTMLAGFQAFLARISQQDDIVVGIPTAGQAALDQQNLIGHCVNSIPFRQSIDVQQPILEFAKQVRSAMMDTLDHQKYTFGSMLKKIAPPRDPSRPPIFSLMFNVDPAINTDELGFGDLQVELLIEPRAFENFELFINGVIQSDGSVEFQCQYNTNLFDHGTVASYFESYEALLRDFVQDPELPIQDLSLLSKGQKQQQLVDWNQTDLAYPTDSTVYQEFQRQAERTPDAVAVVFEDQSLTFQELDARSNQFARYLTEKDVSRGDLVGICVERSAEMLVTLLGIWKAGAGYVPLDPAYPDDRLAYMCEQSKLKLLVTQSSLIEKVSQFEKPFIAADQDQALIADQSQEPLAHAGEPADTAYVIYTSGSTGKPKGVQVPHGAVVNFLYGMRETPGFEETDSILAVTTLSFDIAVLELYLPLLTGGKVVIADAATASDGFKLIEAINQHAITLLQATPATWRLLIASGWDGNKQLKVLCGGEPMPTDLVDPLLQRCGQLWNMYGPTETTVWSSAFRIKEANAPILIGKPIANTQFYLLDANLQPVPNGVPGEVYIGGAGVTLGYLHRDDLTAERFVDNPYFNPFAEYVSHRIYKTGDLARYRNDGNIEFLRRNDKQVKVRGYRIELGEIEQILNSHTAVAQGVVVVREDIPGDARLVAYFITTGEMLTASDLRKHLRDALPHYMIPQHFVELDQFPQTNNGKIDYKALPAPEGTVADAVDFVAPETEAEVYLASVWQELLGAESVSVNDNFFNIGGHSLLVMKIISRIEQDWSIRLGPQDFLMGTLEQVAGKISDASEDASQVESNTTTPDADQSAGLLGKIKGLWN